jgi:hypothetical protein
MVAIRAHFDGKVIVPDEPVDLPRDRQLVVVVEPAPAWHPGLGETLFEWMARNAIDSPSLPSDLSYQHDHYLYGGPRKEP